MTQCPITFWKKHYPKALAINKMTYHEFDELIQTVTSALTKYPSDILCFTPEKNPLSIAVFFAAWRLKKSIYPLSSKLPPDALHKRIAKTKSSWIDVSTLSLFEKKNIETIDPDIQATLIETSSGKKIACHLLKSHLISAKNASIALDLNQGDSYCLNLPLYHIAGIAAFLRTFLSGARLCFKEEMHQATHCSFVHTQLYRLMQNHSEYPKLKSLLIGGGPLSSNLAKKAIELGLPLFESYGMTETSSLAILTPANGPTKVLPHIEFQISEEGEILLKGSSLLTHYFGREKREETTWFATKDLAKITPDKKIQILGRKDRQFISGGENIQPEEIEAHLLNIPSILQAKVWGKEDAEFGMLACADIYAIEPIDKQTLQIILAEKLPSFKIPKQIHIQNKPFESKLMQMRQE